MPTCPQCGADQAAGRRFCGKCGHAVTAESAPAIRPTGATGSADSRQGAQSVPPPAPGSLTAGLGKLGFKISGRQVGGIIFATMAGMVVARVLPYVMPWTIGLVESVVMIGPLAAYRGGDFISSLNSWIVTILTMLTSGFVARLYFKRTAAKAAT